MIPIGKVTLHLVARPDPVEAKNVALARDVVHPHEKNNTVHSLTSPSTEHLREGFDKKTIDIHRSRGHL